ATLELVRELPTRSFSLLHRHHSLLSGGVHQTGTRSRVVEVLDRLVAERGQPVAIRSDNGPEFVAVKLLEWMLARGIMPAHIDPGKPWRNGVDESFTGRFRDLCLNAEWFRSRAEAKPLIEAWRRHYNDVRPHSSLRGMTPTEFRLHYEMTHNRSVRGIS